MKVLNSFIFGGSASIAMMQNNFELNDVLEISDTMINENSYHFHKNYPNINIIGPSTWENNDYLNNLKKQNYDLVFANCPCSSLSQINKNASVDGKNNIHFYRVINIIKHTQPKAFIIENAPTLIKLGYPILLDIVKELKNIYNFTIVRDYAGNHNVPMKRMRTLVVGYNKNYIKNIPILEMKKQKPVTVKDILQDLYDYKLNNNSINNFEFVSDVANKYSYLYEYVKPNQSLTTALINNFEEVKDKIQDEKFLNCIIRNKTKVDNGQALFDKSEFRLKEDKFIPSMTSLSKFIHPLQNRVLTIREYARIMGYPDDFIFYPNECETPIIQCLAQGVPVNFVKYISNEVKEVLNNNREFINENNNNYILCYQEHTTNKARLYTFEDLTNNNELNTKINHFKLKK
jgi:DNA (cytosine-5)-methyltransferase 1